MKWIRIALKVLLAIVLITLALIGSIVGCVAYQSRTIDRTYAAYGDMMDESRQNKALGLRKWVPANAREMSYALCSNAFQKLDYGYAWHNWL